jgi:hypothetical protein
MIMVRPDDEALRHLALERIRKRRELGAHLLAYVLVNGFLIAIWAFVAGGGFFWPMFPLAAWGIGLIFHVWDVYWSEPSESDVEREMRRLRR